MLANLVKQVSDGDEQVLLDCLSGYEAWPIRNGLRLSARAECINEEQDETCSLMTFPTTATADDLPGPGGTLYTYFFSPLEGTLKAAFQSKC